METLLSPQSPDVARVGRRGTVAALVMPLIATGVAMAGYLALRPHGDHGSVLDRAAAEAFASPWWIVSHLCGAFALVSLARLALRVDDLAGGLGGQVARWASLAGLVMVLPYYGAETFGLHALGGAAIDGDPAALELVDDVRDQPAALGLFALGLILLAVGVVAAGLSWQRWLRADGSVRAHGGVGAFAAWPLVTLAALFAAQFYLPPAGRVAFGLLYLGAALVWVAGVAHLSPRQRFDISSRIARISSSGTRLE